MNGEGEAAPVGNLVDLLGLLEEPAEPAPISLAPQTAGWAVLTILTGALLLWVAWRGWSRWRANAYRRAALAELAVAADDPAAIADVLRRTALAAWPRDRVASLSGAAWLGFLDETGGRGFAAGPGKALVEAPYREDGSPSPELRGMAADWIRRHRVTVEGEG